MFERLKHWNIYLLRLARIFVWNIPKNEQTLSAQCEEAAALMLLR